MFSQPVNIFSSTQYEKNYTTYGYLIRQSTTKQKAKQQTHYRINSKVDFVAAGHTLAQEASSACLEPPSVGAWRHFLRQGLETWYIYTGCPRGQKSMILDILVNLEG